MGSADFENRVRAIEANNPDVFKGKRIFSFFAFDQIRTTGKYMIEFYDHMALPQNIRKEIQDAFDKHLK